VSSTPSIAFSNNPISKLLGAKKSVLTIFSIDFRVILFFSSHQHLLEVDFEEFKKNAAVQQREKEELEKEINYNSRGARLKSKSSYHAAITSK
jgi:hypothetical protein